MMDRDVPHPLQEGDMYSTAFQFYSHISANVDPRTGMFSANVELTSGEGNRLRGPSFPFRLSYSALSDVDEGFGSGWRMSLTELDTALSMLTLSSGDTHKVSGLRPGARASFPDRKLESCSLTMIGSLLREAVVEHITGVTEHLEAKRGSPDFLIPRRIVNASGDSLQLHWDYVPSGLYALTHITDDEGELVLAIDHALPGDIGVTIPLGHAELTVRFIRQQGMLKRIVVPAIAALNSFPTIEADEAVWEFDYEILDGMPLLASVVYPDGIRDTVDYDRMALRLPTGAPREYMPAVSRRRRRRASNQEVIQESSYTYNRHNQHNFYGYPAVRNWESAQDQLLHLIGADAYQYGSTETQFDNGSVVCTIARDYDQYHLITRERTVRGSVVQDIVTTYGAKPGTPFEQQPTTFQLPHKVTTSLYEAGSPEVEQATYVQSTYDDMGNVLVLYDSANDTTERSTYYPAEGENDDDGTEHCPPDPLGLVRRLKSQSTEPGEKGGPIRRTHYRYVRVPVRQNALAWTVDRTYYIQACDEMSEEVVDGNIATLVHNEQFFIVDHGAQHGSLQRETREQDGLTETREFTYTSADAERTVTTHTIHTTHDGIVSRTSETLHRPSGLVRATQDALGNRAVYTYDALGRRVSEVLDPDNDEYRVETRWRYQLTLSERWVERIGITGLPHRVWMDEQGRVMRRDEPLPNGSLMTVNELAYDVFGQLVRQVDSDRLADQSLVRRETLYAYDDWGRCKAETAPDGSQTISSVTLVADAEAGQVLKRTEQWQITPDGARTGWRSSYLDAAGRQVRAEAGTWSETGLRIPHIATRWVYDGMGRCIATMESFPLAHTGTRIERITRQAWDAHDRLTSTVLPDGTIVTRSYAPGHEDELIARLTVTAPGSSDEQVLGTRLWDGLGRLAIEQAGSLQTRHDYVPGQLSAARKTMPDGSQIAMKYDLRLREALLGSTLTDARHATTYAVTEASYNKRAGLPERIQTPGGSMDIGLDYLGRMTDQVVSLTGTTPRECHVVVTPGGLETERTGADGIRRMFAYDSLGRLIGVEDEDVSITLAYDAFSRLERRAATSADGRAVIQSTEYDALGRVLVQSWEHVAPSSTERYRLALSWRADDKLIGRRWYRNDGALLREETMDYDDRGRLVDHVIDAAEAGEYPQDEMQHPYVRQQFVHDCIDNLLTVTTTLLDGRVNVTTYGYDAIDIDRLASVSNSLEGYPGHDIPLALVYDANGNLVDDGQGRLIEWDGAGRLTSVTLADRTVIRYTHGPDGRISQVQTPGRATYRYREDGEIAFETDAMEARRYIRAEGSVVAETRLAASIREVLLLGTDPQGSVVTESGMD